MTAQKKTNTFSFDQPMKLQLRRLI